MWILNVIDDFSQECLAAVVDTSTGGARVAREMNRIEELRGYGRLNAPSRGGMQMYAVDNLLDREEALRLMTVGSAWFCGQIQTEVLTCRERRCPSNGWLLEHRSIT